MSALLVVAGVGLTPAVLALILGYAVDIFGKDEQ